MSKVEPGGSLLEGSFTWFIEDYKATLQGLKDGIDDLSTEFYVGKHLFRLQLVYNTPEECFDLIVRHIFNDDDDSPFTCSYKVFLLDDQGRASFPSFVEEQNRTFAKGFGWEHYSFMDEDDYKRLLDSGVDDLYICAEVDLSPMYKLRTATRISDPVLHHVDRDRVLPLSDVCFLVEGKRFPAHKAIVCLMSDVFQAMFCGAMKEAALEVTIEDTTPDAFALFLNYLYECEMDKESLETNLQDILGLADRFDVIKLRELCCNCYVANMTLDNCVDTLSLLHKHAASVGRVLVFLATNFEHVIGQQAFLNLSVYNVELVRQVYLEVRKLKSMPEVELTIPSLTPQDIVEESEASSSSSSSSKKRKPDTST
eukprot:TRINITY_DN18035_c0_g1_i2.p1 TRINITY_DN18035_c0_g1~~TRINITY_DN18035_c0_g1_i2.p1  ORF type:complete len:377 (-),score=34.22 TRINITY_DN18035_c0_g1_i2:48-1154(-)